MKDDVKRKAGRPHGSTSKKPTRVKPLWVRVTAEEKLLIEEKATAAGFKTTSAYIRKMALGNA